MILGTLKYVMQIGLVFETEININMLKIYKLSGVDHIPAELM
jgi:hypothetical protein